MDPNSLITSASEVTIRQKLVRVALGEEPADTALRVGRLLDVATRTWIEDAEIIISGQRIAAIGKAGFHKGKIAARVHEPELSAIPGLGEVHKHIESSHLTPEWEAALVLPRGNTWTCEASHEFSNVNGAKTLEFWLRARAAGSPLKIFPLPGSAVPPTAWEHGRDHFGFEEQSAFMSASLMVAGLDEVMDWPAVRDQNNPAHERIWGVIGATFEKRGVVEGHAAGLRDLASINAFAAAGMASDHEAWEPEEFWQKLQHGLFMELRVHTLPAIIKDLLDRNLQDWSQIAVTTDDRSASDTLALGATDYNVRLCIENGLAPEIAIQLATINPARHMRITPWVGSLAPGRFADVVLLSDLETFEIAQVWADGRKVSEGKRYIEPVPEIRWPDWATNTINIGRALTKEDFAIPAETGRETMNAAILRPFHWTNEFITMQLPVSDGLVQRDPDRNITKFSIIDRYSGEAAVSKMFWVGCGPRDADTALACSMGHDKHNIWCVGSSDEAMALCVNTLAAMGGGWVLVHFGKVVARVRYEVAGLMSARSAAALHQDMQLLYAAGAKVQWMYEPSFHPRWQPGFPERLAFATLTCAPWQWNLVAPGPYAPEGLINVSTGEAHPVVF